MSGEGGAIAEVLAAHVQVTGYNEIGVWFNYARSCSAFGDSDEWHREHVAELLADLLAAERQRGRCRTCRLRMSVGSGNDWTTCIATGHGRWRRRGTMSSTDRPTSSKAHYPAENR